MKRHLIPLLLITQGLLHAGTFVQETDVEFSAAGDFNGDGHADVLVIDRTTGLYRIGHGTGTGGMSFAEGRPAGMEMISGAALGKLRGVTTDSFAVTSRDANRVHVLTPLTPGYTEPASVLNAGIGPSVLAAIDITGGAVPTLEDDLGVLNALHPTLGWSMRQVRSNSGTWPLLFENDLPNLDAAHGNPIVPGTAATALFAYMQDDGSTDSFHAWTLGGTSATEELNQPGLPPGSRYVCGVFDGPNADLMFWVPGQTNLTVRRILPTGPGWMLSIPANSNFIEPISQIAAINDPGGLRLLVRYDNGAIALYSYTAAGGFSPPTPILPAGVMGLPSGIVPMPGSAFHLLFAPAPGMASSMAVRFVNGGSGWTQDGVFAMTPLNPYGIYANVLLLEDFPFRAENVPLLRSYHVGDWSTLASIGGAGPFSVTAQTGAYGGMAQGIGAPVTQTVGTVGATPGGTAVNQMHPQFSLVVLESNLGPAIDEVTISPPAGTYAQAQQISFSGLQAGTTVHYRINGSGAFQTWSTASQPWITRPSTVEFYTQRTTGASPTQRARYEFSKPPALQDTDGDDVPDFVEIAHGLDPAGGEDSDGDDYSDRDELAAGTNPADPLSHPGAYAPAPDAMLVDVRAHLRDVAGAVTGRADAGTAITISDPFGNLVGLGSIGTGGAAVGFGRISTISIKPETGFLIVRTEKHFTAVPNSANEPRGRELVGILPALEPESWSWSTADGTIGTTTAWAWGGTNWMEGSSNWNTGLGDVPGFDANWSTTQLDPLWDSSGSGPFSAAGWVTQFQAAANRGAQPYAEITLTPNTSLEALIVCKMVGDLLAPRHPAADTAAAGLLFDSSLSGGLAALRQQDATYPTAPVVRLVEVLRHVDAALSAGDPGSLALRKLARDLYAQHHALDPTNLAALPMPLDALEDFVVTGVFPADYTAGTSLSGAEITQATTRLNEILSTGPQRSTVMLTLYTRSTPSPEGLSVVRDDVGGLYSLLGSTLKPVALPDSTQVPAGTTLQVTAYDDLPAVAGYTTLEVISLTLPILPFIVDEDTDGDLLADHWELRHFGGLHFGTHDIRDGSLYTLGQEYLEGTDPRSNTSFPPVGPILLAFSDFEILPVPPDLRLNVDWPAIYAYAVNVAFERTDDLSDWTSNPALPAIDAGGGLFTRLLPVDRPRGFFRPRAALKR